MRLKALIDIVKRLRGPEGCPWDREQTRESLKPFLVEELHELIDAIDADEPEGMREESGDMLFHLVIHCELSREQGLFNIDDVIGDIVKKMIRRHPHVFGDKSEGTSEDIPRLWDEHKKKEGKGRKSLMDRIPRALPALLRAQRLQKRASSVGFDWDSIGDVFKKLDEEIVEFKSALESKNYDEIEDELGDILFVLVRVSNAVNVNPEEALKKTISKFIHRFTQIENEALRQGRELSDMSLLEMDVIWNRAKRDHKDRGSD
jgi:tetrapyrrole methylase family protein/MazG family protein